MNWSVNINVWTKHANDHYIIYVFLKQHEKMLDEQKKIINNSFFYFSESRVFSKVHCTDNFDIENFKYQILSILIKFFDIILT